MVGGEEREKREERTDKCLNHKTFTSIMSMPGMKMAGFFSSANG